MSSIKGLGYKANIAPPRSFAAILNENGVKISFEALADSQTRKITRDSLAKAIERFGTKYAWAVSKDVGYYLTKAQHDKMIEAFGTAFTYGGEWYKEEIETSKYFYAYDYADWLIPHLQGIYAYQNRVDADYAPNDEVDIDEWNAFVSHYAKEV